MIGRASAILGGIVLAGTLAALAVPEPRAGDPRIASTNESEVCMTDGLPGSAYSRANRVVARRGVPGHQVDHVLPLCAGGADVDANIHIQPIDEALIKDKFESWSCQQVCRYHRVPLADAQSWFLNDWRAAMRRQMGE